MDCRILASITVVLFSSQLLFANSLSVGTWNIEHLNEDDMTGCITRSAKDYEILAGRIDKLSDQIVAIQEVESQAAAYRVFDPDKWVIAMSNRPNVRGDTGGSICWESETERLRHQGTGFAIRKGQSFEQMDSYEDLAGAGNQQRWGTDIRLQWDGFSIRLLSVHLASGCWGAEQDSDERRSRICSTLQFQVQQLHDWINARNEDKEQFIVLGDFNRRLAISDDWARAKLVGESTQTTLITQDVRTGTTESDWCDARYPDLIDHLIVSNELAERLVDGSVKEHPRLYEHPDHCLISAVFEPTGASSD